MTKENGQLMARELNAQHIEVSARSGFNIPQAFEVLLIRPVVQITILFLATIKNNARK